MRSNQVSLTLALLAAAVAASIAVQAQETPAAPTAQASQIANGNLQPNAKTSKKQSTLDQITLPTIVVTATHRSESIQNVPGGVTSLTNTFLDQIHANSFEQFAGFVPGLSYDSLGPTSDLVAIRGVTTGGTQLSSGIGMYLDQVPIGASTPFGVGFQTIPINTFDLARIEVLNGPQGTLYGANALGGAIKYVPTPPNLDSFSALAHAWQDRIQRLDVVERLMALLEPYLDYALAHPHLFDHAFSVRRDDARRYPKDFRAGLSPTFNVAVEAIAEGMRNGVLKEDDPYAVCMTITAHQHGLIALYRAGRFSYSEAQFRKFYLESLGRLLDGIKV